MGMEPPALSCPHPPAGHGLRAPRLIAHRGLGAESCSHRPLTPRGTWCGEHPAYGPFPTTNQGLGGSSVPAGLLRPSAGALRGHGLRGGPQRGAERGAPRHAAGRLRHRHAVHPRAERRVSAGTGDQGDRGDKGAEPEPAPASPRQVGGLRGPQLFGRAVHPGEGGVPQLRGLGRCRLPHRLGTAHPAGESTQTPPHAPMGAPGWARHQPTPLCLLPGWGAQPALRLQGTGWCTGRGTRPSLRCHPLRDRPRHRAPLCPLPRSCSSQSPTSWGSTSPSRTSRAPCPMALCPAPAGSAGAGRTPWGSLPPDGDWDKEETPTPTGVRENGC